MDPRLAVTVGVNLAATALLAYVGVLVLRRPSPPDMRHAQRMFAVWWFSVAAVLLLAGSHNTLYLLGVRDIGVHTAITYAGAPALASALWSLLYYLIYIYTGKRSAIIPLTIAYAGFLAFTLYYFASIGERRVVETAWTVRMLGETTAPAWVALTFALLLALPVLFVVVAYGLLLARTDEPGPHRRLALTSIAFGQWFAWVLLAYLVGWEKADWFPLVYTAPGIVAGAIVAYGLRRAE